MSAASRSTRMPTMRDRYEALGANTPGVVLVGVGLVLELLAFTSLDWFRAKGIVRFGDSGAPTTLRFSDVRPFLDAFRQETERQKVSGYFSFGAAGPYFHWLGWLLIVVAVAACLVAVSGLGRDHWWFRWTGAVLSALAGGLTVMALDLVIPQGNPPSNLGLPGFGDYVGASSVGAWAAIGGFVLMVIASLLPRKG